MEQQLSTHNLRGDVQTGERVLGKHLLRDPGHVGLGYDWDDGVAGEQGRCMAGLVFPRLGLFTS